MYLSYHSILDELYDFFTEYYLWTSMLSIPHYYRELISDKKDEITKITFLSAIYDFQMKVSAIRSRFYYLLELMADNGYRINDLVDKDVFDKLMERIIKRYCFFHRFDPDGKVLYYIVRMLDDIDWEHVLLYGYKKRPGIDREIVKELAKVTTKTVKNIEDHCIKKRILNIIPRNPDGVNKKINLFLRWMVRDEYPDLGLWSKYIDKRDLLIPMGTEISRTAGRVFTGRKIRVSRKNVIRITNILKQIRQDDPIKYDFVLSRPAILGICNKELELSYCDVCPLKDICKAYKNKGLRNRRYVFREKGSKREHDKILRIIGPRLKPYTKQYNVVCQFDRSIDHDLRPDIFCDYNSKYVIVGEVKTSTQAKHAPIQLKQYLEELLKKYSDREYIGLLVFGKYDPIELKHIIELIELLGLNRQFKYIDIMVISS